MTRPALLVVLLALLAPRQASSQEYEYRLSVIDEAALSRINAETPLNYGNRILPQPVRGNFGSSSLFIASGGFSALFTLATQTDDRHSPSYRSALRECALDLSVSDDIDITVGRKILKWGTGYAFNPTGVLEPQRSPSDPSDRLGENEGNTLAEIKLLSGTSSLTFVYANDVRVSATDWSWGTQDFALRAYAYLSGLDLSLIGHYREADRPEAGLNWSYVIGDDLELHGEFIGKKGTSALYHRIITTDDDRQIFTSWPYAALYDNSDRIFYKFLAGGQYTFRGGLNITLEYYHNAEGLSSTEWNRWMEFVKFQSGIQRGIVPVPPGLLDASRGNLLWALQTLSSRGTMRDYLFGRESWTMGRWGIELLELLNARDLSAVAIGTLSCRLSGNFSAYGRLELFTGSGGSEFGALFNTLIFNLGIQFQL